MIQAKEIDGELWIKASDFHKAIKDAQRPWVGLTDEEIKEFEIWQDNREEEVGWCNPSEIVAYIDSKLKGKNA